MQNFCTKEGVLESGRFNGTMQNVAEPTLVAMATKFGLGAEIQSAWMWFDLIFNEWQSLAEWMPALYAERFVVDIFFRECMMYHIRCYCISVASDRPSIVVDNWHYSFNGGNNNIFLYNIRSTSCRLSLVSMVCRFIRSNFSVHSSVSQLYICSDRL